MTVLCGTNYPCKAGVIHFDTGGIPAWNSTTSDDTITFVSGVALSHSFAADIDHFNADTTAVFYDMSWMASAFAANINLGTLNMGSQVTGALLAQTALNYDGTTGVASSLVVDFKVGQLAQYHPTKTGQGQTAGRHVSVTFATSARTDPDAVYITEPTVGSAPWPLVIWAVGKGGQSEEYTPLRNAANDIGMAWMAVQFRDAGDTDDGDLEEDKLDRLERLGEFRELITTQLVAILGWTPTNVILGEHSAGGDTVLSNLGCKYKDVNNTPATLTKPVIQGGATIRGQIGLSCQGKTGANYTDSWDTLDLTVPLLLMTGTQDPQSGTRAEWEIRKTPYLSKPADLPALCRTLVNGTHVYGGCIGRPNNFTRWIDWLQQAYTVDCVKAWCDYLLNTNPNAVTWLLGSSFSPTEIKQDVLSDL